MTLELREAIPLGQVLVARLAQDAGIRALAIKGPVLTLQGLRGEHQSSDVDVLVDPAHRDRFVGAMGGIGWAPITESTAPRILPQHARTLRHPIWPIEVDVHDRFPGFLAPPQVVFDTLWARHTTVPLAGVQVPTCDSVAHAALVALHHLRDPGRTTSAAALTELSRVLPALVGDTGLEDLVGLAHATGSTATLAPFLESVGAPTTATASATSVELESWRLRTEAVGPVSWGVALAREPVRRWPLVLWHAVWLTDEEIDAFHRGGDDGASRTVLRARRLRRGVRQVPTVVRELFRARARDAR